MLVRYLIDLIINVHLVLNLGNTNGKYDFVIIRNELIHITTVIHFLDIY